jgi:hypothetical protein
MKPTRLPIEYRSPRIDTGRRGPSAPPRRSRMTAVVPAPAGAAEPPLLVRVLIVAGIVIYVLGLFVVAPIALRRALASPARGIVLTP